MHHKVNLSVNLNKVALIRNSRGGNMPDVIQVAKDCESFGADGITVHPRPDERHTRFDDVAKLKSIVTTELNVEGNPTLEFMELVLANKPHQCTLVPDAPTQLTSDGGYDTILEADFLRDIVSKLRASNIRVSIFIDPDPRMVAGAKAVGADRVELYTGPYAWAYHEDKRKAIAQHIEAAKEAALLGIGVNAGHDLNLDNLKYYAISIPNLLEVSIGHALISDALYFGLANVIGMYQHLLVRE
jgi:pyridoxine 5-phosphate synthase